MEWKYVPYVVVIINRSDLNRNDMKTMRRAMFDCYVTCWTAGPTSGHVECMPEIRKHTDNYMDLVMVGWLCLTSHRQRGHLETAFTVPCEGREAR